MDIMTRSERMLRAHRKNNAHEKTLHEKINGYDTACRKRMNRIQQQILDIYHEELTPLQQEVKVTFQQRHLECSEPIRAKRKTKELERHSRKLHLPKLHLKPSNGNINLKKGKGSLNDSSGTTLPTLSKTSIKVEKPIFVEQKLNRKTEDASEYWIKSLQKCVCKYRQKDEKLLNINRVLNVADSSKQRN